MVVSEGQTVVTKVIGLSGAADLFMDLSTKPLSLSETLMCLSEESGHLQKLLRVSLIE